VNSAELKTKIFVDGSCVVCDWEISHYKRIAPERFELVDISATDFDAAKYGLTTAAVEHHMHVLTPEGELKTGVEAFAHIWSRIEKYRVAGQVIQLPLIHSLAKVAYSTFAFIRPILPKKRS
jgi:predicted DCC family thiol-disulfide oxidoreductase YuxK